MLAQHVADGVSALAGERERDAIARRIVFADHAAGIEIIGNEPLVHQCERDAVARRREGSSRDARVADAGFIGEIAAAGRYPGRSIRKCSAAVDDARQRFPFDRNRLERVLRRNERVGDDERQAIADMKRLAARQNRIGRHGDFLVRHASRAGQGAELGNILGGEHEAYARHGLDGGDALDAKARVRMRRAQQRRVAEALRGKIGDIAAAAAQKGLVLLAANRLPETELGRLHAIIPPAGLPAWHHRDAATPNPRSNCRPRRTPG